MFLIVSAANAEQPALGGLFCGTRSDAMCYLNLGECIAPLAIGSFR